MTFLVYCGDKTCVFNNKGKCRNIKIALNEQGICMGYSPLMMPNMKIGANTSIEEVGIENPIGFGG